MVESSFLSVLALICHLLCPCAIADGKTEHYKTEPFIRAPLLNNSLAWHSRNDSEKFIYLTPTRGGVNGYNYGPLIYDHNGTLVWNGISTVNSHAINFHACDFDGQRHKLLCFYDGDIEHNPSNSVDRFLGQELKRVKNDFSAVEDGFQPNYHELYSPPAGNGESFLRTVYRTTRKDVNMYNGRKKSWVIDPCVQEINTKDSSKIFQWCALDHSIPSTWNPGVATGSYGTGRGTSRSQAWDFFHLNSIDKTSDGDYVISSGYLGAIFLIAGKDIKRFKEGSVMLQVGGKPSNFNTTQRAKQTYIKHKLERPRMVRVVSSNQDEHKYDLLILDNSGGSLVTVDTEAKQATVVQRYLQPPSPRTLDKQSGGSIQRLPNNNIFIGWGSSITEFSLTGNPLYHADLIEPDSTTTTAISSFRAYKHPLGSQVLTKPKLLLYKLTCEPQTPLKAYISWNGAPNIARWRLRVSTSMKGAGFPPDPNDEDDETWYEGGVFRKNGFESELTLIEKMGAGGERYGHRAYATFVTWGIAEALDEDGEVLGRSEVVRTFVPSDMVASTLRVHCDERGCGNKFEYDQEWNGAAMCKHVESGETWLLVLYFVALEMVGWLYGQVILQVIGKEEKRGSTLEFSPIRLEEEVGLEEADGLEEQRGTVEEDVVDEAQKLLK